MPRAGALLLAVAAVLLAAEWAHASYIDPGEDDVEVNLQDYGDDPADLQLLQDVGKRSSLIYVFRRACVRRGGNCDHRPGDCCHSSSCRCNLWGPIAAVSAWASSRNGGSLLPWHNGSFEATTNSHQPT